jgi:hypothetical protein
MKHMYAFERTLDLGDGFLSRGATDLGTGAGAQTLGDLKPELDAVLGDGVVQRLGIGVGDNEVDTLDLGVDHVGDGVASGSTDTDHSDARAQLSTAGGPILMLIAILLQSASRRPDFGTPDSGREVASDYLSKMHASTRLCKAHLPFVHSRCWRWRAFNATSKIFLQRMQHTVHQARARKARRAALGAAQSAYINGVGGGIKHQTGQR